MPSLRLVLSLFAACLLAAGCGGEDSGGDDPASVLPAGSPLVVELSTGPDSRQGQAALEFAERVDPGDRDLGKLLEGSLDEEFEGYSYAKDVKPWLGQVAVAVDGFEEFQGVVALEVRDEEAARAFVKKVSQDDKYVDRTYENVSYQTDPDGTAQGFVDGYLVVASDEARFKRAIDASQGKGALTDDAKYKQGTGRAPDERLALGYVELDPLVALLEQSEALAPQVQEAISQAPGLGTGQTAVAALVAREDRLILETAGDANAAGVADPGPDVASLPASAWIAAAGPVAGPGFLVGLEQGLLTADGTRDAAAALDRLKLRAFLEGLKRVSVHFGGTEVTSLSGGLKLTGDDEQAAAAVVGRVAGEVRRLAGPNVRVQTAGSTATLTAGPYTARLAAEGKDLSLELGRPSSERLEDRPAFQDAVEALDLSGATHSVFVDFPELAKLVANLAPDDPQTRLAIDVLDGLDALIGGTAKDGETLRARFVLTLR